MTRAPAKKNWVCASCDELVPHNFSKCWNCGVDQVGNVDPQFVSQNTGPYEVPQRRSRLAGIGWFLMWIITCSLLLFLSNFLDKSLPEKWTITIAGAMSLFFIGLIAGVIVNMMAQVYPFLSEYFNPREREIMQITDTTTPKRAENESSSSL